MKKWKIISMAFCFGYIIFAQSCLRMRTNDKESFSIFNQAKVKLQINNFTDGNLTIHYAKTGNDTGSIIVFIHGSPGDWHAFQTYLLDTHLIAKYQLISIDRPGFGYSNFNQAQNLFTQTRIINQFIESVAKGKKVYLVGHSYGGPLVASIASTNKNISGIVIIAGALSLALEKPEKWRKLFIDNPFQYLAPGALRPSNYELWWLKNDLEILSKKLSDIHCKAIIIHGTKDRLVDYGNLQFMKQTFTKVDTLKAITIKEEDHFIPWT
ncbi:MAG: alpha/beta hydrolase, partial [Bacteroidia bacterium]|nr:alpha/beta hydrolase [Bacteroidia bacterium]